MSHSATLVLTLALLGLPSARDVASAQTPELLTVEQAVAAALARNRQIQTAALDVGQAQDAVTLATLRRLPVFGVNLTAGGLLTDLTFDFPAGAFGSFPGIGPVPAADTLVTAPRGAIVSLSGSIAQPLTQLRRINLGVAASTIERDVRRARADSAAQAVVANVRRLYYGMLQTESRIGAIETTIEAAREVERIMQARATERVVLVADAAEAAVRLARAERARLELTHTLASQREQFSQLLGRDLRAPFVLTPVADPGGDDVELNAVIRRALEQHPDVREARLRVQQAEIDREMTLAGSIPDVSLTFSYFSTLNTNVLPRNLAAAGVQVKWEPWEWGRTRVEAGRKAKVVDQARLAVKEAEDRLTREILETRRSVERTRANVRLAALVQAAARERLRVLAEQLRVSAALSSDVLQVEAQLADATAQHQEAISAFWTARADFDRATGEAP
jgi:outer membrane protein TolC